MNIFFHKTGMNLSLDKLNYDIYKNQFNYEVNFFFLINQPTLKLQKILLHIGIYSLLKMCFLVYVVVSEYVIKNV